MRDEICLCPAVGYYYDDDDVYKNAKSFVQVHVQVVPPYQNAVVTTHHIPAGAVPTRQLGEYNRERAAACSVLLLLSAITNPAW
ncbi:jg16098 [Pararge aegeria aegeria]|uniref:Jg16098 protein n=1 Tax=Pararge aegeria aegeria TaxID=348720 RepID=A0A8S4RWR1_9NEOP|nr:jg16098 [Pararge aegeria aegeria]